MAIDRATLAKIMVAKSLRVFGSALMSVALPIALLSRGYDLGFIGIITSLVILSNIPFNILLTFFIKHVGTRKMLVYLSVLMATSGLLFFLDPGPVVVVIAAIIGMVSPNGTEVGPFQSVEQALISASGKEEHRTTIFSVYNFIGYGATSLGSLFSGLPEYYTTVGFGVQSLFLVYSALAIIQGVIQSSMRYIDARKHDEQSHAINRESRKLIFNFSALFSVDAFGGGFVVKILLTTWFTVRFGVSLGSLSSILFIADVITAFSIFTAPLIAKRIGLLKTMVFVHLLSNIFLICVPLSLDLSFAVLFLFFRQSISQIDVPTRQSYMNALIKPEDRAGAAAITNTVRTAAQSISPPIATALIGAAMYALPFLLSGGLKIVYDVAIYITFRKIRPPEEHGT